MNPAPPVTSSMPRLSPSPGEPQAEQQPGEGAVRVVYRGVPQADAASDDPCAGGAPPDEPGLVFLGGLRALPDHAHQQREQKRGERQRADDAALGERIEIKAMAMAE